MPTHDLHTHHERSFESSRFVYPVLSRRSGGLSIGVNLNPDKICNFDCIYCQVDRTTQGDSKFVETEQLIDELHWLLDMASTGAIWKTEKFANTPKQLQRLNDIAFSGDGEPTTYRNFDQLMADCAAVKRHYGLDAIKMVLITNASMFHRPHVQRGLQVLDANNGEIWAKLDAGTEAYYQLVDRTPIPFQQVLDNIAAAAQERPIVIQSLFMKVAGEVPPQEEVKAYCQRLNEITAGGGALKLVQIYTIARRPTESYVEPLSDHQVDELVSFVRTQTGLNVAGFYGCATS